MRVLGFMMFLLSLPIMANTQITTQVHEIDYGQKMGDEILVLLKSGHVAKITPHNKELIENLIASKSDNDWHTFKLDKNRFITEVLPAENPVKFTHGPLFSSMYEKSSYVPTTVSSMDVAKQYHREGRRNGKDSQCFNRAMIWTYEWWKKHSLKSQKILIFFTRNYIRRYNFEWWFHIAPYLHVKDNGRVVERVMDLKYTSKPLPFRDWTNIFMRNDAECPVITKYSEYADFPYTGECYITRTSMYTYQPADIQMNEAWNYTKTSYNLDEVKAAYLEAFDVSL